MVKQIFFKEIENPEKDEESKLTALPKQLHSKNDSKEAIKLIEDIWADTNNVKSSSGDKKVLNDLDKLTQRIKKLQKKIALKEYRTLLLIQINKGKNKVLFFKKKK